MSQISDAFRGLQLGRPLGPAAEVGRSVGLLLVVVFAVLPAVPRHPAVRLHPHRPDPTGSDWASALFLIVVYMMRPSASTSWSASPACSTSGYVGFYALGAYSVALFGSPSSPVVEAMQSRFGLSDEWAVPVMCIPIAIAMALTRGDPRRSDAAAAR